MSESETSITEQIVKATEETTTTILKKISDNKIYIIIAVVIALGWVMYYFYCKNNKQVPTKPTTMFSPPKQGVRPNPKPKQQQKQQPVIVHPPLSSENESESSENVENPQVQPEDDNLSQYDLTNSELKDINTQLESVQN